MPPDHPWLLLTHRDLFHLPLGPVCPGGKKGCWDRTLRGPEISAHKIPEHAKPMPLFSSADRSETLGQVHEQGVQPEENALPQTDGGLRCQNRCGHKVSSGTFTEDA